ncbi:MAG: hypothetical protein GVY34_08265 [Alphaproteobacteria bacterium]|jgi:hypothetical protein|nr:hypothetical protein [Alphaproteobacteria bacterium]
MSFIDTALVDVRKPLLEARFPFGRAERLGEARGIVVIRESRQGKSTKIETLLRAFNDGSTSMPDGRPAKIVSCLLSGKGRPGRNPPPRLQLR